MKDHTLTETVFEHPSLARDGKKAPGVVQVFSSGVCAPLGYRVLKPRTFGRDAPADVVLEDKRVSRVHVRLEPFGDGVLVTDLDSRNGSFIDGERIASPRTEAPFGSMIRLGKTLLYVLRDVACFAESSPADIDGLVGGPALHPVRAQITTYADSTTTLLLQGETGTGKEVVAAALHAKSGRTGELVALNCAAIAPDLVESELFGHTKGAFSGSAGVRQGLFRTADRGTLLLDEIGELPPAIQSKLLRVLETNEVRAVGGDSQVRVDVRVLAATNRDLDSMVGSGAFRGDLLHRIAALRIHLPALRERLEDVPLLCASFLRGRAAGPDASAIETLMLRTWSGNVRELKYAVLAAATAAEKQGREHFRAEDIPEPTASFMPVAAEGEDLAVRIREALARSGGNVTKAATELEMARSRLYELLKRLRIDATAFRRG